MATGFDIQAEEPRRSRGGDFSPWIFVLLLATAQVHAGLSRHNEQGLSPTHSYKRTGPSGAVSNLNGNLVVGSSLLSKPGAPLGVSVQRTWNSHWRDPLFVFQYDMDYSNVDPMSTDHRRPEYSDISVDYNSPMDIGGFATRRQHGYDTPAGMPNMWSFAQAVSFSAVGQIASDAIRQAMQEKYASYLIQLEVKRALYGKDYKPSPELQAKLDQMKTETGMALQALGTAIYLATSAREDIELLKECASSAQGGKSASGDCGDALFRMANGTVGTFVAVKVGFPVIGYAQLGYNLAKGDMTGEDLAWAMGNIAADQIIANLGLSATAGAGVGIAVGVAIQMTRMYVEFLKQEGTTFDVGIVHLNPWAIGVNGYVGVLGVNHDPELQRGQSRFGMSWTMRSYTTNEGDTTQTENLQVYSASRHPMPELHLVGSDGGASRFVLSDDSAITVDGVRWVSYVSLSNSDLRKVLYRLPTGAPTDHVDLGVFDAEEAAQAARAAFEEGEPTGHYLVKEPDGTQVVFGTGSDKGIANDHRGFHVYWAVPSLVRHPVGDSIRIVRDDQHRVKAVWDVRTGRGLEVVPTPGLVEYRDVVYPSNWTSATKPVALRVVETVRSGEGSERYLLYSDKDGDTYENVGVVHWESRKVNDIQTDTTRFGYRNGDLVSIDFPSGGRNEYTYNGIRKSPVDGFVHQETEFADAKDGRFFRKRIYDFQGWTEARPSTLRTGVTTVLRVPDYVGGSTGYRESEMTDWYHFSAQLAGVNVNRSLAGFKGLTTAIRPDGMLHDTDKVLDSMEYKTTRFQLLWELHGVGSPGTTRKQMVYDGDRVIGEIANQGLAGRYAPVITTREYDAQGGLLRERVCPRDLSESVGSTLQSMNLPGVRPSMLNFGCPEKELVQGLRHVDTSEFWLVRRDTLKVRDSALGDIKAVTLIGSRNTSFQPFGLYQIGLVTSQRTWRVDPVHGESLLVADSTDYEDFRPGSGAGLVALVRPVTMRRYDPQPIPGESWPVGTQIAYADGRNRPALPAKVWKRTGANAANLAETDYDATYAIHPVESRVYPSQTTLGGAAIGTALTTKREYDWDRGWVLKETSPGSRITSFKYDSLGRVTQKTAPDGGVIRTVYLDRLQPLSSWRSASSVPGLSNNYPQQGTLAVRETDPVGVTTEARFDGLGRLVAVRKLAAGASVSTLDTSLQQTTLVSYNVHNKLQWKRDPDGRQEHNDFDGVGRLTHRRVYLNPDLASGLSLAWENRYFWNDSAKSLTETDPLGTRTTFHSDVLGRDTLIERDAERLDIQPVGNASAGLASTPGTERIRVRQRFDNFGNVVRITDPKGLVETRRYDVRNRLHEVIYPDDLRHALGYDLGDRVVVDTLQGMRNGAALPESMVVKSLTYDGADRVTAETFLRGGTGNAASGFGAREDVRFAWDSFGTSNDPGQLLGVERGTGLVASYTYDLNGRRKQRQVEQDEIGYSVSMATSFDSAGSPVSLTLPGGARQSMRYDAFHRPVSLSQVLGSDSLPLWHGATYRRNDLQDGFRLGSQMRTSFQYESRRPFLVENRVERVVGTRRDTLYHQRLSWDAAGNVGASRRGLDGDTVQYHHDRLGQLRISVRKDGFDSLTYDPNGNRISHRYTLDAGHADSFRLDANRVVGGTTGRKGHTVYRFDVQGNQALEADFANSTDTGSLSKAWRILERRFNRRNELERLVVRNRLQGDSSVWAYTYDEAGNRIGKRYTLLPVTGSDTAWTFVRHYAYDGVNVVADSSRGDSSWAWWGFQGYKRLAWADRVGTDSLRVRYLLTDHLGTANALVDDTGAVLSKYMLDPWGNVEQAWETVPLRYRYTGKEHDPEAGRNITYVNARFLDNERGGWISRDPKLEFFSPYGYIGNGVQTAMDPDGQEKADLFASSEVEYKNMVELIPDKPGVLMLFFHGAANMAVGMSATDHADPEYRFWDAKALAARLEEMGLDPKDFKKIEFYACWTGTSKPVDKGDGTMVKNSLGKEFSALYPKAEVKAPNSVVFYTQVWNIDEKGDIVPGSLKSSAELFFGDPGAEDYYRTPSTRRGSWIKYKGGK